jgi:hypothetical protein
MKLTPKLAEALVRLRHLPEFKTFIEVVRENELSAMNTASTSSKLSQVRRAQGEVAAFRAILRAVDDAPAILEKFNQR